MIAVDALRRLFLEADPRAKATAALASARLAPEPTPDWPDRPGRPEQPILVAARAVPKRSAGSPEGRVALLHALAHIELNAIDLALDIVGRFIGQPALDGQRDAFAADWLGVAAEEAKHYLMLADRLVALGSCYGAMSAHDGLWQGALRTHDSLLDRLAIAPLTQEARGLDVTPALIAKLEGAGDDESARILGVIYRDEIGHVAIGHRWFVQVCAASGDRPDTAYRESINRISLARPHAPFNEQARRAASLNEAFDVGF